jgi:nucleotide-binding universal stress UspA family protein
MAKLILCATDGSEHSGVAVTFAGQLAKFSGAKLVILSVNVAVGGPRGPLGYQRADAEVRKMLDEAASTAKQAGASECRTVEAKSRDAARAILQCAEEEEVDHIVLGTGDRSMASRLALGSVSREVSAKAHCCVTVAR